MPASRALATAAGRLGTWGLTRIAATWVRIVFSQSTRRRAISWLPFPVATRARTSSSRGVSSAERLRRVALSGAREEVDDPVRHRGAVHRIACCHSEYCADDVVALRILQ